MMRKKSLSAVYFKNLGLGKRFMLGRYVLEVKPGFLCIDCCLNRICIDCNLLRQNGLIPHCQAASREDAQNVVFKEVKARVDKNQVIFREVKDGQ